MCLIKKKKMQENVKVGLLLRTEISTSIFFFSVLLPSFCTTKHSRKLTLNSALIFSRRSHDFSAYIFFFDILNLNFILFRMPRLFEAACEERPSSFGLAWIWTRRDRTYSEHLRQVGAPSFLL